MISEGHEVHCWLNDFIYRKSYHVYKPFLTNDLVYISYKMRQQAHFFFNDAGNHYNDRRISLVPLQPKLFNLFENSVLISFLKFLFVWIRSHQLLPTSFDLVIDQIVADKILCCILKSSSRLTRFSYNKIIWCTYHQSKMEFTPQ